MHVIQPVSIEDARARRTADDVMPTKGVRVTEQNAIGIDKLWARRAQ